MLYSGSHVEAGGCGVFMVSVVESVMEWKISVVSVRGGGTLSEGVAGYGGSSTSGMSHGEFSVLESCTAGVVDVVVAVVVQGEESVWLSGTFSQVGPGLEGVAAASVVLN